MKKRMLFILSVTILVLALSAWAVPSNGEKEEAARRLYDLGVFHGVGKKADGTPDFDLNRAPTRQEGITMLVRLVGKKAEARRGHWSVPFTDVDDWAKPYVGYAYENGLTFGISNTKFGGSMPVSAAQYVTFVLRAMGYEDRVDFQWNNPWTLSNELGFTTDSINKSDFTRGDAAEMSYRAMMCTSKGGKTLGEILMEAGVFTEEEAKTAGLTFRNTQPPAYWKEAVDNLVSEIKTRKDIGGARAFQFLWMSDIHGVNGYTNTNGAGTSRTADIGKIAAYVMEKYDLSFAAVSGDIMSQASHISVDSVYQEYADLKKMLNPIPAEHLLAVMGNHDGSWGAPENGVYYLKYIGDEALRSEIYRFQASDERRVFGPAGSYFYVDSPQRVRFIMLNSQTNGDGSVDARGNAVYNTQKYSVYGSEQLTWVAETALDMPEGWTAVIMAHAPLSWSKDGTLLARLIDAYNMRISYSGTVDTSDTYWGAGVTDTTYTQISVHADFSEAKGEVAAFFYGHIHRDSIDTTTYSFPTISITTAGADVRDTDPPERIPGTATETAMDIVTLDTANRMIYMNRLGAGEDRMVRY